MTPRHGAESSPSNDAASPGRPRLGTLLAAIGKETGADLDISREQIDRGPLDAQVAETLLLATVTLAEVRLGIAALPEGKRRAGLTERFETDLLPLFAGRILTFDEPSTREYAILRTQSRAAGLAIGDFDALIASIAKAHRFGIATRDVAPFEAAGVATVVDPFT